MVARKEVHRLKHPKLADDNLTQPSCLKVTVSPASWVSQQPVCLEAMLLVSCQHLPARVPSWVLRLTDSPQVWGVRDLQDSEKGNWGWGLTWEVLDDPPTPLP